MSRNVYGQANNNKSIIIDNFIKGGKIVHEFNPQSNQIDNSSIVVPLKNTINEAQ